MSWWKSAGLLFAGLACFVVAVAVDRWSGLVSGIARAPVAAAPSSDGASTDAAADTEPERWAEPVVSYQLSARLDPEKHQIAGHGTIELHNVSSASLPDLYVHLYLNAFESESTVFMRRPGSGFRGTRGLSRHGSIEVTRFYVREMDADVWPADPKTEGEPTDRTDIRLPLPRPIARGETIHIDVTFLSTLPSVFLRTGAAGTFHMVAQWFPKLAKLEPDGTFTHFPFQRFSEFYSSFGDYDVEIDAPAGYVVGATGALGESTTAKSATGERSVSRYRAHSVHDFAFAAWDRFEEQRDETGPVRIRCLYPPGYEVDAQREIDAAKQGLSFFGTHYGAYPYENLTIVHPPPEAGEAGGMEYPTLITTGGPWWLGSSSTRAIELLTLHELAHQWFYGMIATNENAHPFLDEGLTTYAAGEAASAIYGDHPVTELYGFSIPAAERVYAKHVADRAPVASAADAFATGSDYARLVYYRTSTIMHTLDRVYDGAASRGVARYARENRFAHPGPGALLDAIEHEGGAAARAAAERTLFDRASVDFRADALGAGAREVTIRRDGALELPVDVTLIDVEGRASRVTWNGEGSSVTLGIPVPLRRVLVDPEVRVLLDDDLLDDGPKASPVFPPRVSAISLLLSQLALGVVLE